MSDKTVKEINEARELVEVAIENLVRDKIQEFINQTRVPVRGIALNFTTKRTHDEREVTAFYGVDVELDWGNSE